MRIEVDEKIKINEDRRFGELSIPCFGKSEEEIGKIKEEIKLGKNMDKIELKNNYLNIYLSDEFYKNFLKAPLPAFPKNNKTAVIDYSCPNVGKPLHVGHLRSTIYGDSIKKLLNYVGYKTIGFNYLGDAGKQVALLLLAIRKYGEVKNENEMLERYVKINEELKENQKLEAEVREIVEKIEKGDERTLKEVEKIRNLSYGTFERVYKKLGVEFDEIMGESQVILKAKKMVVEVLEKGIAKKGGEGEIFIELEKYGLPNTILMRSNGTTLYLTRDLALAEYKWEKYKFDLNFYATASAQNLHFKQLFKILELLGKEYSKKCAHVGFGLVGLESGKLSTREGRVVLLEETLKKAVESAREEIKIKGYSEEEKNKIAEAVGIGAIKFWLLKVSPEKNVIFNFKKMVSFEGDTSAYLQYTLVRANSILRKATEEMEGKFEFNEEEKNLLWKNYLFEKIVKEAAEKFKPHLLANYLLKLSAAFSIFYENNPVLKAEKAERKKRIAIVKKTRDTLKAGLELLGVPILEKM